MNILKDDDAAASARLQKALPYLLAAMRMVMEDIDNAGGDPVRLDCETTAAVQDAMDALDGK
jgi:hypothetical protein